MSGVRKIVLATDAVGGVWTYSLELARALNDLGIEPVLAVMGPSPGEAQKAEASGLKLIDTGLPLDWLAEGPGEVRRAGYGLDALARAEGADIVQLNGAALAADTDFDRPVVVVQHSCVATWWQSVREGPLPAEFCWRKDLAEAGLNRASAVVAPTAAFAAQTVRAYGLGRAVQTVHNGRKPIPLKDRSRSDLVFTVGRLWDEGKNVRVLDEAAASIDAKVEAIGPVEGPNGCRIELSNMEAPGRLPPEEIAQRLSRRPIFASAALYEPFGLSALEAAQAGCALVLSDIPTLREVWSGAALFVSPTDPDGFAEAINALLRDPDQREAFGRAAQLKALRYTPTATARRMLALYDQLLQSPVSDRSLHMAGAA